MEGEGGAQHKWERLGGYDEDDLQSSGACVAFDPCCFSASPANPFDLRDSPTQPSCDHAVTRLPALSHSLFGVPTGDFCRCDTAGLRVARTFNCTEFYVLACWTPSSSKMQVFTWKGNEFEQQPPALVEVRACGGCFRPRPSSGYPCFLLNPSWRAVRVLFSLLPTFPADIPWSRAFLAALEQQPQCDVPLPPRHVFRQIKAALERGDLPIKHANPLPAGVVVEIEAVEEGSESDTFWEFFESGY